MLILEYLILLSIVFLVVLIALDRVETPRTAMCGRCRCPGNHRRRFSRIHSCDKRFSSNDNG